MMRPNTILLLEDSDDDAYLTERALRSVGIDHPLERVRDGHAAIALLENVLATQRSEDNCLPILLLTDISMPGLNGLELLRWVRTHPQLHPMTVIMLSASEMDSDLRLASQLHANAYIVKPSEMRMLEEIAESLRKIWLDTGLAARLSALVQNAA